MSRHRGVVLGGLAGGALLLVSLCPIGVRDAAGATRHSPHGGIITFAESTTVPNYIFPVIDSAHALASNYETFQTLMWPPLYWLGSNSDPSLTPNYKLSMAEAPQFSDDDKTITMVLKKYFWSTGTQVTARDLVFWMNVILNNKTDFSYYIPGGWMDHVASDSAPSPTTFVLRMSVTYSRVYLLSTVLPQMRPIPQQSWDKTSANSPVGNYDESASGAKAVYRFMNGESLSTSTYDTNPLWQVVDGPWRIEPNKGFQVTGQVIFIPNQHYSGPNKPVVAEFETLPFLSTSAEFTALRSGSIDDGYLPNTDLEQIPSLKRAGYTIKPWETVGIDYITFNFSNPRYGSLVDKLYVRQAMQSLIDQPAYVKDIFGTYGRPEYGPVPTFPPNPYASPKLRTNPYPYDPAKARRLLEEHGWLVPRRGIATCTRPGTESRDCGPGIAAHTRLVMPVAYTSGVPWMKEELEAMQASFKTAGIDLTLKEGPFTTIVTATFDCQGKTMSKCSANSPTMSDYGGFDFGSTYPFGSDTLFGCHAGTNTSNFCTARYTALLNQAERATTSKVAVHAIRELDVLLANDLPVLWLPLEPKISVISPKLGGVKAQSAEGSIYPSTWYVK